MSKEIKRAIDRLPDFVDLRTTKTSNYIIHKLTGLELLCLPRCEDIYDIFEERYRLKKREYDQLNRFLIKLSTLAIKYRWEFSSYTYVTYALALYDNVKYLDINAEALLDIGSKQQDTIYTVIQDFIIAENRGLSIHTKSGFKQDILAEYKYNFIPDILAFKGSKYRVYKGLFAVDIKTGELSFNNSKLFSKLSAKMSLGT